jgi:hypothetical protein
MEETEISQRAIGLISPTVNSGPLTKKVCSSDVMHCQISIFEIKMMVKITLGQENFFVPGQRDNGTHKLMAATKFSDYLGLKHYKKAKKIKHFIHLRLAQGPQSCHRCYFHHHFISKMLI